MPASFFPSDDGIVFRASMHLVTWYQQHKDKWWCLPLFLPLILLPIARLANIHAQIGEGVVVLYFLPLALMITLMLFFGWAAIPGMILAIILNYRHNVGFLDLSVTIIQLGRLQGIRNPAFRDVIRTGQGEYPANVLAGILQCVGFYDVLPVRQLFWSLRYDRQPDR